MKASRHLPTAVWLICVLLAGLPAVGWDEPPAESEPASPAVAPSTSAPDDDTPAAAANEAEEAESEAPGDGKTKLRIECDLDCMVTVGLELPREVKAEEPILVEIEPGAVRVKAHLLDVPEATTFEDVSVEAGERRRIKLKMADALTDLRKLEARDRTYRDADTRLMWPTRDNGLDVEWAEAADYCATLEHGGWTDWRLPTLAELEAIEAMWSLRPYKTADPIGLTSCCAWSSDRVDGDGEGEGEGENAWNFNYRFRRAFRGHVEYSLDLRALCVRDGSDEIPENTRKNRRIAKREAKEKERERIRRQQEREAEKAAATADEPVAKDDGEG